jgi:orotate phosphoribosyltransferase
MVINYIKSLTEIEKKFIESLYNYGCLKFGDFTLKSLRKSPYFIEMQESFSSQGLIIVGKAYLEKVINSLPPKSFNSILAPAEKGTALALALAFLLPYEYGNIPVFWNRKQSKGYGSHKRESWIVGPYKNLETLILEGEIRPIIIDDVIVTGGTKKDIMKLFEDEILKISREIGTSSPKITWIKMYIAVNRREVDERNRDTIKVFQDELNLPIEWITDSYNIYGYLGTRGIITKKEIARFIDYQKVYGLPEDREKLNELSEFIRD